MRTRSIAMLLSLLAGLLVFPGVASAQDSAEICDTEGLVEAVEGGPEDGTLAGMADDPVGTAASSNPVLTTLVTAASAAGLVDTLNSAEALTVFAPTDCAFAELDPATLDAALADPSGLLTTVLGFHVIPGERLLVDDLSGDYETFTGEMITVNGTDVDGQADILVPDIETANATVHLIGSVMLPPSVTEAAQAGGSEEPAASDAPTDDAMATDAPTDDAMATDAPTAEATDAPTAAATAAPDSSAAPTGGVATGAGGTADSGIPVPLLAVGFLALIALGGALIARKSA